MKYTCVLCDEERNHLHKVIDAFIEGDESSKIMCSEVVILEEECE